MATGIATTIAGNKVISLWMARAPLIDVFRDIESDNGVRGDRPLNRPTGGSSGPARGVEMAVIEIHACDGSIARA